MQQVKREGVKENKWRGQTQHKKYLKIQVNMETAAVKHVGLQQG